MSRIVPLGLLWLLLICTCAWIYAPGFDGPSLLDDNSNLAVLNQLEEGSISLENVVLGNRSGPLGRPISMLSFSLERLYIDAGLRGTKQFNLALHILIASLMGMLAAAVFRCLQYPSAAVLGLCVAALWLLSPLFTSTALYTVQRMAQLSTLFTLIALLTYMVARSVSGWRRVVSGLLCILALMMAPLSKENGLLAIPLLMLLEVVVLRFKCATAAAEQRLRKVYWTLLVLAVVAVVAALVLRPEIVTRGYIHRDFTLFERLLTQTRILWVYVGQLVWADPAALGILQDDQLLSRSVFEPLTTLWALLAWLAVAALTVFWCLRPGTAALGFGMAFFMLAHSMESTVFPLELYFEHRNYLPGFGLFLTLVAAAFWLQSRLPALRGWLLLLLVVSLGRSALLTATEAEVWSNSHLFYFTAVNRFPESARSNSELSRTLAESGYLQEALVFAERANALDEGTGLRLLLRRATLTCIAEPRLPASLFESAVLSPGDFSDDAATETFYLMVKAVVDGRCPDTDVLALTDALSALVDSAAVENVAPKVYLSLAILENANQRFEPGLFHLEPVLRENPEHSRALMMKLYFASVLERDVEREQALEVLLRLRDRGALDRDQYHNLSVLAEPPP